MLAKLAQYPTYQVFMAMVIALVASVAMLPLWMRLLRVRNIGQQVRADGPQGHLIKQGTPTMGGVLILFVVVVAFLVMGNGERSSLLALAVMIACGVLGFIDDWSKVAHERSLGLRPRAKFAWQGLIAIIFCLAAVNWAGVPTWLQVPLTNIRIELGAVSTTLPIMGGVQIIIPWLYMLLVFIMILVRAMRLTSPTVSTAWPPVP